MHSSFSEADTAPSKASGAQSSSEASSSARLEVSHPEASPLTSFPAPSTPLIQDSASVKVTLCAPMSEDAPTPQADPGPAQSVSGEVSETPGPGRADQDGVSETPALVGSGGTSDANPQEAQLSWTKIPSIPQPAIKISSHADPSE